MNPANRPAEVGGIAGAVALLVAHLLGVNDTTTIISIATILGFVPAAITWIVTLIRGKSSTGLAD
jgi:hypothetical protein